MVKTSFSKNVAWRYAQRGPAPTVEVDARLRSLSRLWPWHIADLDGMVDGPVTRVWGQIPVRLPGKLKLTRAPFLAAAV